MEPSDDNYKTSEVWSVERLAMSTVPPGGSYNYRRSLELGGAW